MDRKILTDRKMQSVPAILDVGDAVSKAAEMSVKLTAMRTRCPGDIENAMRSIERDYGVDYWTLWRLRYRQSQVTSVCHSVFSRLWLAYQAECERQLRKM